MNMKLIKKATLFFCLLPMALFFSGPLLGACSDKENVNEKEGGLRIDESSLVWNIDKGSTSFTIPVETNLGTDQWQVDYDAKWLQCTKQKGSGNQSSIKVNVNENTGDEMRTATLKVTSTISSYTIKINQYAKNDVIVEDDILVKVIGGQASENQPGQGIENSFDGKFQSDGSNPYHSKWSQAAQFPVVLEYYFKGDVTIDYLIYYTRSGNGNFGKLKLYVATDAAHTYKQQGEYDFLEQNAPSRIVFPEGIKATAIKFEVLSGLNDFVSCDEMEFYRYNTNNKLDTQLLTVFTDITCSQLKDNITDEQIKALPSPFFIRIAEALRDNTYNEWEKEFRIRNYEPYSNIHEWAKTLMTKRYSDLDNPTGISVKAGDEIIVLVGDTYGQNISLQCIWENEVKDGSSSYKQTASSGDSYMLKTGVNKLTMKSEGQLFVMYNTDITSASAKPIKIHIPLGCGAVNGFFDLKEHKTDAKYAELLKKATHKYFCVKGERIMFYFHRTKLLEYVPDRILSAINLWDNIIGWEQDLMGIDNVRPSQVNNHMFAISPEGSYMWASDYQIAFVYTYLSNILLYDNVMAAEDNAWGPAHEIGHVHQMAINWAGCTESSNNLFSNYVIYKLGKYKSRGNGLIEVANARYRDKQAWYNMGDATHQNEDTEVHMRMNWQLWNYYHRCGYKKDFWQTLFKLMREEVGMTDTQDPGRKQLEFAKMASKAANENLTDFFEMWGFFEPVDATVSQYGDYKYYVSQSMIDAAKRYMGQFPKPKHAFQYIEDRKKDEFPSSDYRYKEVGDVGYYETFQKDGKITAKISATISGRRVSITNGSEAVAFELREGSEKGKLLYFSNFLEFEVPSSIPMTNAKLYAVQADGVRIALQ